MESIGSVDARVLDPRAARLDEIQRRTNGATDSWLPARRRAAFERFEALGFPTLKHEAWRHTNVGPIARTVFSAAPTGIALPLPGDVAATALAGVRGPVLVLVNGRFVPELSQLDGLPRGVRVQSLAAALAAGEPEIEQHLGQVATLDEYPFTALNTALLEDGAFVHVGRGAIVEDPIQLVFFSLPGAADAPPFETHPRVLVVAEEGSHAVVAESWTGTGAYLSNAVTEVAVGPGAAVTHSKVQRESRTGFHVARVRAALGRDARFESYALAFGAAIARNEVDVVFGAEGGECRLGGLYAVAGKQLSDNQTFVDHTRPHCTSNQLYKGVLTGESQAVFNGRVAVRPQAQKTVAHQTNRNLLLSERALVDTKPQLEIYADDVQCTHGATIGRLQEEQVFYLLSRGIGRAEATDILMQAFARDAVSQARPEAVRAALEGWIGCRMAALGNTGGAA